MVDDTSEPDGPVPPPLPPPRAVRLTVLPPHACPYLPGRTATLRAFSVGRLDPDLYHGFMDAGFRRSGRMVYQPVCDGCRRCVPIRVPTDRFRPDKTQRRCVRRNADLTVTAGPPMLTDEKLDLYQRYVGQWHDKATGGAADADGSRASLEAFLYASPVATTEFTYRDAAGRLLAVGIADVLPAIVQQRLLLLRPRPPRPQPRHVRGLPRDRLGGRGRRPALLSRLLGERVPENGIQNQLPPERAARAGRPLAGTCGGGRRGVRRLGSRRPVGANRPVVAVATGWGEWVSCRRSRTAGDGSSRQSHFENRCSRPVDRDVCFGRRPSTADHLGGQKTRRSE